MNPQRVINAVAPTRICDVGGWTETESAADGALFQMAVYPHVEVQLFLWEEAGPEARFTLSVEKAGRNDPPDPDSRAFRKLPLIEAALKAMDIPSQWSIVINLFSHAPANSSLGTSAAVSIAIIGALAEFERNLIRERVVAGLETAKRKGTVLGRPKVAVDVQRALRLREEGLSWRRVSKALGVDVTTLRRAVRGVSKT